MSRYVCLSVLLLAGCHTHEVRHDQSLPEESRAPERPTSPSGRGRTADPAKTTRQVSSERPVRTTAAAFFDAATVRKLQAALTSHGEKVEQTGELDGATHAALRRFQKSQAQPATGFPDFDTIKRLGLDPKDIYLGKLDEQPPK